MPRPRTITFPLPSTLAYHHALVFLGAQWAKHRVTDSDTMALYAARAGFAAHQKGAR